MRYVFSLVASLVFTVFFLAGNASANNPCRISNLELTATIIDQSKIEVTEKLVRQCPERSSDKNIVRKFSLVPVNPTSAEATMEIISLQDENGESIYYQGVKNEQELILKINNNAVTDKSQTFLIKYRINNLITQVDQRYELSWRILGTSWNVFIDSFKTDIIFPKNVTEFDTFVRILDGVKNSQTNTITNFQWFDAGNDQRKLTILSNNSIPANNGIAVVASTTSSEILAETANTDTQNNVFIWLLLPLIGAIISYLIWLRYGKDPSKQTSQSLNNQPPRNLSLFELAFIDGYGKTSPEYITATVFDLAIRRYIQIEQIKVDKLLHSVLTWQLVLRITDTAGLKEYEKQILKIIFGENPQLNTTVIIEELNEQFYAFLPEIQEKVEKTLNPNKLLEKKSYLLQIVFIGLAIGMFLTGLTLGIYPTELSHWRFIGISVGITGIPVLIAGIFMSKRTTTGAKIEQEIIEFKKFLGDSEKVAIEQYSKTEVFEKYLPYAIGFELTNKWLEIMNQVYSRNRSSLVVWPWLTLLPETLKTLTIFTESIEQLSKRFSEIVASKPANTDTLNDN